MLEKVIKTPSESAVIVQSNYDFLYNVNVEDTNATYQKVTLESTFLGDTVYCNDVCYHITNNNVYTVRWDTNSATSVLDWTTGIDTVPYSGVVILEVRKDVIIFLATTKGVVVCYSTTSNEVLYHTVLDNTFYTNVKHIIFKNTLYLIDGQMQCHSVSLPESVLA